MSVEFVEPERTSTSRRSSSSTEGTLGDPADVALTPPPRWRRWILLLWLTAGVLLGVAPLATAYVRRQTAFIQDFDGVHPVITDQPVDGLGHVGRSGSLVGGFSISASAEPAFGFIWIAVGAALLIVAALTAWRPSGWTTALAGALAAAAAGSLGTMWFALQTSGTISVPNLRREVIAGTGFWLASAGTLLAALGAVAVAITPWLHRSLQRRRHIHALRRGRVAP